MTVDVCNNNEVTVVFEGVSIALSEITMTKRANEKDRMSYI